MSNIKTVYKEKFSTKCATRYVFPMVLIVSLIRQKGSEASKNYVQEHAVCGPLQGQPKVI